MNDVGIHLFREISGQPALWRSIGSRADEVYAALEQARTFQPSLVHVTGRGSSAHAAYIIGRQAEKNLHVPSRFFLIEDAKRMGNQPSHSSLITFPRSIAFVVSQSGQSPDLLAATNELRQHAELVIAISNSEYSPLASAADVYLDVGSSPEIAVAATKTFSGSVVMGMLALAAVIPGLGDCVKSVEQLADVADESLLLVNRIPEQLLEDIATTGRVMIVGPANNLGIAREAALKLSENAGITAVALSASDAIHGPLAQVSENVTVLVLLSTPGAPEALHDFSRRVASMSRRVWHLDATGFHRRAQEEPKILGLVGTFAGLLELIPLQWLSGVLAQRCGMDPDSPRALVKETLTN